MGPGRLTVIVSSLMASVGETDNQDCFDLGSSVPEALMESLEDVHGVSCDANSTCLSWVDSQRMDGLG